MVSQARLESNRANAKKSTGPRSINGKKRSSMNALKHGMTARLALLPDEDPALYDRRRSEWVQNFRPRSDSELFQAERAVYCSWQLQRAYRAGSARLTLKAHTAATEQRNREEKEAIELAIRLFRMPGGSRSAGRQPGFDSQELHEQTDAAELGTCDDCDHPALLVVAMEASECGCRWMLDRWNELGVI
jgi:hypothetical protein